MNNNNAMCTYASFKITFFDILDVEETSEIRENENDIIITGELHHEPINGFGKEEV